MLLEADQLFVIPDMEKDWRFQGFMIESPQSRPLRFYASAPIVLSAPPTGETDEGPVQVGRLTIMSHEPREDMGEDDSELLLDIARMAQEALENEYLEVHAKKVLQMQREAAKLAHSFDMSLTHEENSSDIPKVNSLGISYSPKRAQEAAESLYTILKPNSVMTIDVSNFRVAPERRTANVSMAASSPRSSIHMGGYPATPWLRQSTTSPGSSPSSAPMTPPPEDRGHAALFSGSESASTTSASSVHSGERITSPLAPHNHHPHDASSPSAPKRLQRNTSGAHRASNSFSNHGHHQHNRSTSTAHMSAFSAIDEETCVVDATAAASIIVKVGDGKTVSNVDSPAQTTAICSFLTFIKKHSKQNKPLVYSPHLLDESSSDEDATSNSDDVAKNPLSLLVSSDTKVYATIPIFTVDKKQPLFICILSWNSVAALNDSDKLFCYTIGKIVQGAILRSSARHADRAQLDFIRSVQHELRTPLNGILGITDFLRQGLVSGETAPEKLDMGEDGLLASLLESIRLAGVNLSTILDDVLDFGAISGLRTESSMIVTRSEEVDLVREVEDVCLDELEYMAMHERQDRSLLHIYRGFYAVPTLVIKVAPELRRRFRTDRSKLKKILSKFIANALRYSNESQVVEVKVTPNTASNSHRADWTDQWADFVVQDTGIGMSHDFVANSLLKPFVKADSFSQGVGLGVTIAASLISQMGGRLQIQSDLGVGTRVSFTLPLGQDPDGPSSNRRSISGSSASASDMHIKPYQVHTVYFHGFDVEGHRSLIDLIYERLSANGVRRTLDAHEADLMVVIEAAPEANQDVSPPNDSTPSQVVSQHDVPLPRGPHARTVVVTRNALKPRPLDVFEGHPIVLFRPPFGPSSLDTMDDFLREDHPFVLHRAPTPMQVHEHHSHPPPPMLAATAPNTQAEVETKKEAAPVQDKPKEVKGPKEKKAAKSKEQGDRDWPHDDRRFRVLVVEDNPINMRLLTTLLDRLALPYVEAKDGLEAVDRYKKLRPSVVLLDISLPLLDGFEACTRMRAHHLAHTPRIIAVTALSSNEDKVKGIENSGMDDWRTKPLSIKTLRQDILAWKEAWDDVHLASDSS